MRCVTSRTTSLLSVARPRKKTAAPIGVYHGFHARRVSISGRCSRTSQGKIDCPCGPATISRRGSVRIKPHRKKHVGGCVTRVAFYHRHRRRGDRSTLFLKYACIVENRDGVRCRLRDPYAVGSVDCFGGCACDPSGFLKTASDVHRGGRGRGYRALHGMHLSYWAQRDKLRHTGYWSEFYRVDHACKQPVSNPELWGR